MKKTVTLLMIVVMMCVFTAGCASLSGTENGALIGAGTGSAIGAIFGKGTGAVIGGLSGAVLGAVIGNYYDKQVASREQAAKKYQYKAKEDKLEIEKTTNTPEVVSPGSKFESNVQYTVLLPDAATQANVVEMRFIDSGKDRFKLSERNVARTQGTHLSTARVTLPKDLPSGDYNLITVISGGTQQKTVKTPFTVA